MSEVQIKLPRKIRQVFTQPRGALRYRGAFGGRGSGKSFNFAKMAAIWGYMEPLRFLCVREFQNSIPQSFHAELKAAIASEPWLETFYDVGVDYLRGANGTEFLFKGLRNNIQSVKSLAKIDVCIVEEAEDIAETAWEILEPTIRAPKSEIWVIWNPKNENSATDRRFRKDVPPRSCIVEMNYNDNPFFPDVLKEQRLHQQKSLDPARYAWIWEGAYYELSDAQVFRNKYRIDDFEPSEDWEGPYFGLDFGFSVDPTACVKCWIYDGKLWIEREAGGAGIELDDTAAELKAAMPDVEKYVIRADSARPESISYLKRHGLPRITGALKGKGSVEDGIGFIRSFDKVVIHTRCEEVAREFRLYSYETDRLSGDVKPKPEDKHNHYIDALRYALEPMTRSTTGMLDWIAEEAARRGQ
ncbi:PBSX family phage terminase large subunit [Bergeriella denitrificans]|uniref:Phage associated protein n=1 Tax=Bergeriella denitrificans TaxID=494 RepID=A0A378UIY9_BERDE|nr:PBSX family phage terminase large subunit [Bergeriella denitrificans]STZ77354.1 phage associated protein [Bergeriella denitrificans]